jgi:predicted O-methyltransferase YrrM
MNMYQEILRATENLDGWCTSEKSLTLANLVLAVRPRCIVEIGVWGGKSLIPMAIAARHIPHSIMLPHIIGIDPWQAEESVKGQDGKDAEWWQNQAQHDLVYGRFMAALQRLGLQDFVEVQKTSSDRFMCPTSIDLLHVDGNHGPQAFKDVQKYGPAIGSGGVCVLDDLHWSGGNVGRAADWLKANGFVELHPLGTGAVYLKVT